MPAFKIIKRLLDTLELKEKPYDIWDSEVKGFIVTIFPTGRKTFSFRYYDTNKKNQRIKIGIFGNITCETAREIAKGLAGDLAKGIDPKKQKESAKAQEKSLISFSDFFEKFTKNHRLIHHKATTIKVGEYMIKSYILPFFGHKNLEQISAIDIMEFKELLKKVPGSYNKCFVLLHKAFELAELWGFCKKNSNPCHGIQKYPERKKERFLNNEELERLEEVLEEEEALQLKSLYVLRAIRMLIYTGCRMNEILTLKWKDVYLEERYIHLTDSKTGERFVPLNEPAKKTLEKVKKREGNPYVFCGGKQENSHVVNIEKAWQKIRKKANLDDVRIHDLRHSFASFALKKGLDLYQIAKLLGHRNIRTTTRYAHLAREDLIKASNIVGQTFTKSQNS